MLPTIIFRELISLCCVRIVINIVIISAVIRYVWRWWVNRRRVVQLIEQIPGPPALPLLGNAIEISVDHDEIFTRIMAGMALFNPKEGIVRMWHGRRPWVALYKHNLAEVILSNPKHINKSSIYSYMEPWLGMGLLTSSGTKWRTRRKIITPAFHFRILENFLDIFQQQSDILVNNLGHEIGNDGFDIFHYITLCTLDIICESAMGIKMHAQENSNSDYVLAVKEIGTIIQSRQSKLWLQPNTLFYFSSMYAKHKKCLKILHSFSRSVIAKRKEEMKQSAGTDTQSHDNKVFIDLLIEASQNGKVLSDDDIREEVDTFIFEGHDTTSAAISWTLYLLGCHPDVQDKVMDELRMIFGTTNRPATVQDLNRMRYLECCIKETLRLYPSVPMMARQLQEPTKIGNYLVPAGTGVLIVTYMIHRDSEIYVDPEYFRPERFYRNQNTIRYPYAYIPFSAGPRNCIGQKYAVMEEKVVLSTVLRKFSIKSLERRENLKFLGELILRPKHKLLLQIVPRI